MYILAPMCTCVHDNVVCIVGECTLCIIIGCMDLGKIYGTFYVKLGLVC